jgi:hypothetical protein
VIAPSLAARGRGQFSFIILAIFVTYRDVGNADLVGTLIGRPLREIFGSFPSLRLLS